MKTKRLSILTFSLVLILGLPIFGVYGSQQREEKSIYDEDRRALLNYYVSELTQHGYYLIAAFFGFFGALTFVLPRIGYSELRFKSRVWIFCAISLVSLLFSTFILISVYIGCRLLYYGFLTACVIDVPYEHIKKIEVREPNASTMALLHYAAKNWTIIHYNKTWLQRYIVESYRSPSTILPVFNLYLSILIPVIQSGQLLYIFNKRILKRESYIFNREAFYWILLLAASFGLPCITYIAFNYILT